jgi:hypothetical protein
VKADNPSACVTVDCKLWKSTILLYLNVIKITRNQDVINSIIRTRTRHSRYAYHPTRDNIYMYVFQRGVFSQCLSEPVCVSTLLGTEYKSHSTVTASDFPLRPLYSSLPAEWETDLVYTNRRAKFWIQLYTYTNISLPLKASVSSVNIQN